MENLIQKQNFTCALSGLPISFDDSSASLDRIDNQKDYENNKIQWLHLKVNYMKNIMEQKDYIHFCKINAAKISQ
jgi:hypothetical protein